jgi:hypothetical protein
VSNNIEDLVLGTRILKPALKRIRTIMRILILLLPFLQLGFAAQVPLLSNTPASAHQMATDFTLTESENALSPKDMLTLPRPGAPLPNDIGDLAIVPITTHSFQDRKYVPPSFSCSQCSVRTT